MHGRKKSQGKKAISCQSCLIGNTKENSAGIREITEGENKKQGKTCG